MNIHRLCQPKNSRGFSLIELLISTVIGLIVIAGSVNVVVSSKTSFYSQEEMSYIQDNARFAIDVLSRDIRMAGYMGCATPGIAQIANSVVDTTGGFITTGAMQGFDFEAGTNSYPNAFRARVKDGTDAILVRRSDNANALNVKKHKPKSATIQIWGNHEFMPGTTLMIADASCRHVGIFQVSGPASVPASTIVHNTNTGGGNPSNNCTKVLKGDFECNSSCTPTNCDGYSSKTGAYGPGSKVMQFVSNAYYIADSLASPGTPALVRQTLLTNGVISTRADEIAQGVEDMQMIYGVDSDDDGEVDQYRKADDMDVNGDGVTDAEDWNLALAVKLNLIIRSENEVYGENTAITLNGINFNDRFMRQAVNTTIQLRNRG